MTGPAAGPGGESGRFRPGMPAQILAAAAAGPNPEWKPNITIDGGQLAVRLWCPACSATHILAPHVAEVIIYVLLAMLPDAYGAGADDPELGQSVADQGPSCLQTLGQLGMAGDYVDVVTDYVAARSIGPDR